MAAGLVSISVVVSSTSFFLSTAETGCSASAGRPPTTAAVVAAVDGAVVVAIVGATVALVGAVVGATETVAVTAAGSHSWTTTSQDQ